jgi:hypothetical protein
MGGAAQSSKQNASIALFACGCSAPMHHRIPRAIWMRLLPALRLYRCRNCGARVLRRRIRSSAALGAAGYLPPFYLHASTRHAAPARPAVPVLQLVLPTDLRNLLRATGLNAITLHDQLGRPPLMLGLEEVVGRSI